MIVGALANHVWKKDNEGTVQNNLLVVGTYNTCWNYGVIPVTGETEQNNSKQNGGLFTNLATMPRNMCRRRGSSPINTAYPRTERTDMRNHILEPSPNTGGRDVIFPAHIHTTSAYK